MGKENVVYTYNGILIPALNRKEMLQHEKTWMNLEDIMLNEINQLQKDEYCMIPLKWGI